MMVGLLFIIDFMGLFFYNKIGSTISIGDLSTTNIIEPKYKEKHLLLIDFKCQTTKINKKRRSKGLLFNFFTNK